MKRCYKCGSHKALSEFPKSRFNKDGYGVNCHTCNSARLKSQEEQKCFRMKYDAAYKQRKQIADFRKQLKILSKKVFNFKKPKINRENSLILEKLRNNIRKRLKEKVKTIKSNLNRPSFSNVGCKYKQLQEHIESLWQEGMSWANYGHKGWHIDHKKPLALFDLSKPEEISAANHYTNLQPLWAKDNYAKDTTKSIQLRKTALLQTHL